MMLNAAAVPQGTSQVPELGHLKAAAERISQANYNLTTFIQRFTGPIPEGPTASAPQGEPVPCYKNDLTAVFDQIAQLEALVNGLTHIG